MAVVFGINSVSKAGKKIVTVQGAAEHYYIFHTCIVSNIKLKYYSKPYCYKLIQHSCTVIVVAVNKMDESGLRNKVYCECLPKKTKVAHCFIHGKSRLTHWTLVIRPNTSIIKVSIN